MTIQTTIIRIGNSLGSRYSRAALDKLGLREGDHVEVTITKAKPDKAGAIAALRTVANLHGTLSAVDVERWQQERLATQQHKDGEIRDILGR